MILNFRPLVSSLKIFFNGSTDIKQLFVVSMCVRVQSLSCVHSLQPHRLQPATLLCPWDFPGKKMGWSGLPFPPHMFNTLVKKKQKTCNLEGISRFTLKRYLSYLGSYDLYTHSFKGLLFFQIYTNCLKVSQQTRVTKKFFFLP